MNPLFRITISLGALAQLFRVPTYVLILRKENWEDELNISPLFKSAREENEEWRNAVADIDAQTASMEATTFHVKGAPVVVLIDSTSGTMKLDAVAHEAVHVAMAICEETGVELSEELCAYIVGYVCKTVMDYEQPRASSKENSNDEE